MYVLLLLYVILESTGTSKAQNYKHEISKHQYQETISILNSRPIGFHC